MKIAVIRKNGIGDFIAGCVPLCNYLIERYGDVEFHFFMTERNAVVAQLFFPKAYVHVFQRGNKYFSHWKMAQKCKYLNFDIGISPVPESSKLNNLFLWALCAKDRCGRYTSNWFSKFSINHRVLKYDDKATEQVGLSSLKLFDNFCFIPMKYYPRINTALLDSYRRKYQRFGILLEVSNARYCSQLSNDKMASLIEELSKNYDISVMITAMEKDRDKAKALEQQLNVPTEFFVTQDFKKYVEFVNAADIVLCGDGGLMHIAAALNKKVVALFARTSVRCWQPLGEQISVLSDTDNVNNIADEEILSEVRNFLCNE